MRAGNLAERPVLRPLRRLEENLDGSPAVSLEMWSSAVEDVPATGPQLRRTSLDAAIRNAMAQEIP